MAIEFQNVTLTYGSGAAACTALSDVSLSIAGGELVSIVGASGSGKTTLLNLAAGLCSPTAGSINLLGQELGSLKESAKTRLRSANIGFVFQSLDLLPTMTTWQNIELPLVVNGLSAAQRTERVNHLLGQAGLLSRAKSYPDALSNGQRQQVAILRAVAHSPQLVLMDEPTSSLDSAHAAALLDLVIQLNRAEGTTVVFTTHDAAVAAKAARTMRLRDGRLCCED